jgi:hypothetical protein
VYHSNWIETVQRLRTRLTNLAFCNGYTIFALLALVIGCLFLLRQLAFFAYNQYAKATFMKPFYAKVALAQEYNNTLTLDNFVSRATTHASNAGSKGRRGWVENCTTPGTYFDYQAHTQLSGVRFCSYGYISYFWVNSLDAATIDHASQQMQSAGWTLQTDAAGQAVNKQRASSDVIGGYSFSRPDGVTASMMFISKQVELQNSGAFSGYPYWSFVKRTRDPHSFFIAVNVSYEVRMQGGRLLGN